MKNKKVIIAAILGIILIAGIVMAVVKGFNFESIYTNAQEIELRLNKEFNINDVQKIAQEVFGKDVSVRAVELYNDAISVTSKQISDEKKEEFVTKINEKYGSELKAENTEIHTIPNLHLKDLLKNLILPFVISTSLILIYQILKYFRLGFGKVLLKTILALAIAEAELMSLIAITRFPVGTTTIALILFTYMFTLIGITSKYEQELQEIKAQDEED